MTHTQKQEQFETKVGITLQSSHTFKESEKTTWFLRVCRNDFTNSQSWVMWGEREGKVIIGTQMSGQRLSKVTKETFGI